MNDPLIDIWNLSLSLGGKAILHNISLSVPAGETVSLIGPNGAGKTSLLKCLVRICAPDGGDIRISGRSLRRYGARDLARRISYVPQDDGGASPFTVRECVAMGRYPHLHPFSSPTQSDREAVRSALAVTGLSAFADRPLGTLSGGERRKASIAAALAQEAEIMILDEPAAFLDPRNQADIHALLIRINRERGVTVVSATHDVNAAGSRVAALVAGKLAYWGPRNGLLKDTVLDQIYGLPFLFAPHPRTGAPIVIPDVP